MEWSDTQTVVRLWSLRPWLYKWHQVPPLELPDKTLDDRWRKWLREASLLDNSRDFKLEELSKHEMNVVERAYRAYLVVFSNRDQFEASANDLQRITKIIIKTSPLPPPEALEELNAAMLDIPAIQKWRKQLSSQEDIMLLIFVCYNYGVVKKVSMKLDGGVTMLKKIMFDEPLGVQNLRVEGNQNYNDARCTEAIRSYTEAMEKQAYGFKLYSNRALVYRDTKQWRAEASDGLRCVRIEPTWDKGWRRYAEGLFHLGLYIEAWEVNREGQSHCACTAELKKQAITFQENLEAAAKIQDSLEQHPDVELAQFDAAATIPKSPASNPTTAPAQKGKGTKGAAHSKKNQEFDSDCDDVPDLVADTSKKITKKGRHLPTSISAKSPITPASTKPKTPMSKAAAEKPRSKTGLTEKKEDKRASNGTPTKKRKEDKLGKATNMTKELSPLALDTKNLLSEGTKALLEKRMRNAASFFTQALSKIDTILQKELLYHDEQVAVVRYALGYASIHIGTEKDVEDGLEQFHSIETNFKTLVFPLAYLGIGMAYCRWNRYKEGHGPLAKGLRIVNKHAPRHVLTWPESIECIQETKENKLKESFEYYLSLCRQPPKPDAMCRFKGCGQYQIAIYITDPDFKGYVEVHCFAKCRVAFHYACWKKAKSASDKELLNGSCWTPDCSAPVRKILMIDQNGEIAKDLSSENSYIRHDPKKVVIKMKPSSEYTIERRVQKKRLRKELREAARLAKLHQDDSEKKKLENNEENCNLNVTQVKAAPQIDLKHCTKILPKREELEEEDNKKQRKKKRTPKDKVLTLIDFNNQEPSSRPPSTPSLGSFGGLDDFDDYPVPLLTVDTENPFSVPPSLVPALAQFEGKEPQSPATPGEPSPNPWTRKATLTECSTGSLQAESVHSDENEIDEANNRLAIRNSLFELFKDLLQKHGPLHCEDPLITSQVADFPPTTQDIIDAEGGLNKFLGKSLYFAILGDHVGLLKDATKIRKIAAKKKIQSRKNAKAESASVEIKSEPTARASTPRLKTPSPACSTERVGSVGSVGGEETSQVRPAGSLSVDSQSTGSSLCEGSYGLSPGPTAADPPTEVIQPRVKVVSPVLDQYRLGVNRLQVAMELGGLARRVNLPLGVEVRLLYGWTILDGLREGEQEEVRELALSMLQDTLDKVVLTAHRNYQAHSADIYFFGVGETSADSQWNRWVMGPEVGRNQTIVISLLFGDLSVWSEETAGLDAVSYEALLHVNRAAQFIAQCGDRFRASLDIQKAILPIFTVLGKSVAEDPETLALLEATPVPAIPKPPPGLGVVETVAPSSSGCTVSRPASSTPSARSLSPLNTDNIPASLGGTLFMPSGNIWSADAFGSHPGGLPYLSHLYTGPQYAKESSDVTLEKQMFEREKESLQRQVKQSQMDVESLRSQVTHHEQQLADLQKEKNMYAEDAHNLSNKYKVLLMEQDLEKQQYSEKQRHYEEEREKYMRETAGLRQQLLDVRQSWEEKLQQAQRVVEETRHQLQSERELRHAVEVSREQELLQHERALGDVRKQLQEVKQRAETAEVNQLRIKLDVGLMIINRSAKEAEAKVAQTQQEFQSYQEMGYPVPEAYRAAERAWKKTVLNLAKTKDNSTAQFEEQMRRVRQGEKLSSLPVLDIPCPPPPPELPQMPPQSMHRFSVGGTGDGTTGLYSGGESFTRTSLSSTTLSNTSVSTSLNLQAGAMSVIGTKSKVPTAADIVAAHRPPVSSLSAVLPPAKKPISRPPGFGLSTAAAAAASPKAESKKNSFDKLFDSLLPNYPQFTKSDMSAFLRQLREERGSLSGLSLVDVKEAMEKLIKNALLKKATRPSLSSGWSVVGAKRGTGLESFTSHLPEPPEEDPCTICLDDLTLSPSIQLACKHHFHDRCIRQWFTSSSTCPLCQKHVLLSDEYPALS